MMHVCEMVMNFIVLVMAENENNRSWYYKDLKAPYTKLLSGKTISRGETYIHFNFSLKKILKEIVPDVVIASGGYLCPGTWKIAKIKKKIGYKAFFGVSHIWARPEKEYFDSYTTKRNQYIFILC